MSTLNDITVAHAIEGSAKAYRYYQCTGRLGEAMSRYHHHATTRVERRLMALRGRRLSVTYGRKS